jgi:small GTP-binding protein
MGCTGGKKSEKKGPEMRMSKSEEEKKKERLYEIKIVLLGDPAVGKSSLVQRYCADKFEDKYKITIGGAYLQKEEKLKNGDTLKLHIWDTGGQEKFRSMASLYYKDAVAAILVYDVSNKESLESLDYWVKELKEKSYLNDLYIVLAGNKKDKEGRTVSYEEAKKYSDENKFGGYFEVSAKSGEGIEELFTDIAKNVLKKLISKNNENTENKNIQLSIFDTKSPVQKDKACC